MCPAWPKLFQNETYEQTDHLRNTLWKKCGQKAAIFVEKSLKLRATFRWMVEKDRYFAVIPSKLRAAFHIG